MPIYDLDDKGDTLFEPLKIKVGGMELIVEDFSRKEVDAILELKDPYAQVAAWTKTDVKEIHKLTMRQIAACLKIIIKEIFGPAVGNFIPKKA